MSFCLSAILPQQWLNPPHFHTFSNTSRHTKQNLVWQLVQVMCLQPQPCSMDTKQFGHSLCVGICSEKYLTATGSQKLNALVLVSLKNSEAKLQDTLGHEFWERSYHFLRQTAQKVLNLHLVLGQISFLTLLSILTTKVLQPGHSIELSSLKFLSNPYLYSLRCSLVKHPTCLHSSKSHSAKQPGCGHRILYFLSLISAFMNSIMDYLPIKWPHFIFTTPFSRVKSSQILLQYSEFAISFKGSFSCTISEFKETMLPRIQSSLILLLAILSIIWCGSRVGLRNLKMSCLSSMQFKQDQRQTLKTSKFTSLSITRSIFSGIFSSLPGLMRVSLFSSYLVSTRLCCSLSSSFEIMVPAI